MSQRLYSIASKINAGKLNTEIGYSAIFLTLVPMAIAYTITASAALAKLQTCKDFDENKKRYLSYTLTVGLTIPIAFLISKLVRKDVAVWMVLYGAMALAGAAIAMEATEACGGDETEKMYNSFYIMGFSAAVVMGLFAFFFV